MVPLKLRRGGEEGEEKAAFLIALQQKEKIQTATPPPHHLPLASMLPSTPTLENSTSAAPGRPSGEAEDKSACAPRPHPGSASFSCGGRSGAGKPPPPALREVSTAPRQAVLAGPRQGPSGSSAPTLTQPLPSPDPPSLSSSEPVPAPGAAAATATSAPAGSAWLSGRCLPLPEPTAATLVRWPAPRLPPSFPPPSTGSRDGDRRCAANPTPSPGYFPPPRSREKCAVASGSSRETHHHGSGCSKSGRVLKLGLGGGMCGGWKIRRQSVKMRLWGLR